MLFKEFVPFGNTVHFIAQDFYFLYQRHKKNQTVKILYNSIRINPSINTCIPIHVYKNSRYIYMYNNSETKAVINSKLNQFLQIKQRLHHHLKLHYKHEYVGVLIQIVLVVYYFKRTYFVDEKFCIFFQYVFFQLTMDFFFDNMLTLFQSHLYTDVHVLSGAIFFYDISIHIYNNIFIITDTSVS